jgi:hypothetical protein
MEIEKDSKVNQIEVALFSKKLVLEKALEYQVKVEKAL